MSHIFISYSRNDIDFAGKIVQALAENDLDTWIDWKSIPKGEDWEQEIYRGIEEADAFLFLISPDSVASQMCNKEIEHAVKNSKRILPILISNVDEKEIHRVIEKFPHQKQQEEISRRNFLFCRQGRDDFNKAIEEIRTTIHIDYEWLRYHTELQVKALKWEQKKDVSRLLRGNELRDAEQQLAELNAQEDPQPTKLQREYVLTGRRNEDQQRRRITIGLSMGLVVTGILAIFAWIQRNEAVLQSHISLARQLSTQAQSIFAKGNDKQELAVLLAIQSMQLYPSIDAEQILQNNILAHPISSIALDTYVWSVDFSPDGKYVVSGGDHTVRVWDALTGEQIAEMNHDDLAKSVAFSPNGKYVVSGSNDYTARVWDISSGEEIARMTHNRGVSIVRFSPDGKYVVSGSNDDIRAWDSLTGKEISQIVPDGSVNEISFNSDGKYVAIATGNNMIQVWEIITGDEVFETTFKGSLYAVALSPDGKYVVAGGANDRTRAWDVTTGKEISSLSHESNATLISFSSDGRYVATGFSDGTVVVWDVITGNAIMNLPYYKPLSVVTFIPDGKYVLTGDTDGIVHVWDFPTGKEVSRMIHIGVDGQYVGAPLISSIAFSPDGKQIVSGAFDGTARIWEIAPGTVTTFTEEVGAKFLEITPDGRYLVSIINDNTLLVRDTVTRNEIARTLYDSKFGIFNISSDGKYFVLGNCVRLDSDGRSCIQDNIRIWDSQLGQEIAHILPDNLLHYVAFSPDGKHLITTDKDATIRVWESTSGEELAHMTYGNAVNSVIINSAGNEIVSGGCEVSIDIDSVHLCTEGTARAWDLFTGREISRMTYDSGVDAVAISPDGKYAVSMSSYEGGNIWEINTGKEIAPISYDDLMAEVAFSPDGKYLISRGGALNNFLAFVWDAGTGEEIIRIPHDEHLRSVVFSPDSKYLASVSVGINDTIHIWESTTGKEIARMIPGGSVTSAVFSTDGKYLISSGNGIIYRWTWRPGELPQVLIKDGCSRVNRNLTRFEWRQYIGDTLQYQAVCPNLPIEPEVIITPIP